MKRFIKMTDELFKDMVDERTTPKRLDPLLEQKHQDKIQKHMKKDGFITINLITAGKAGHADILAVAVSGQAWFVEVKRLDGEVSNLQYFKLKEGRQNNAVCMVAWGYDDFVKKYNKLKGLAQTEGQI